MTDSMDRVPIEPQSLVTPLSKAAVFLVLKLAPADEALTRALEVISDIGGLIRWNRESDGQRDRPVGLDSVR